MEEEDQEVRDVRMDAVIAATANRLLLMTRSPRRVLSPFAVFTALLMAMLISAEGAAARTSGFVASNPCTPQTSLFASSMLDEARFYATDSDSLAVAARQSWGLSPVSASTVTIVTDSTRCARALQLHQQEYPVMHGYLNRVVVVRLGHLRAVTREPDDPTRLGHQPMVVTDSTVTTVIDVRW